MNAEKLDGHLAEPHSVRRSNVGHRVTNEVLQDVTSNLPTSNHRGQSLSVSTSPSPSNNLNRSHGLGIKTENRDDSFSLRSAHTSLVPKTTESSQTSIPRKISESGMGKQEDEHPTEIRSLQDIVAQLAKLDQERADQENREKQFAQRIEKGERAHGELLQRLSQIQQAVERSRELIRSDKEEQLKCRMSQRQAIAKAETLHASLSFIAAGSDVGSSAPTSNR